MATQSHTALTAIADLICGIAVDPNLCTDLDHIGYVGRLRTDVTELHSFIKSAAMGTESLPASAVFPFLSRKFLELSLTSVLARVDPMRVLAARKNQLDDSYEPGQRNLSSISWLGDIYPSRKPPIGNIWDSSHLKDGPERSLLGWHIGEAAISPGLRWLTDKGDGSSRWLNELSKVDKPLDWIKGHLARMYSAFSKGIHAEYLLDDQTAFDKDAITQYMHDCYMSVCLLAASTHASPLFARSLPPVEALEILLQIERDLN